MREETVSRILNVERDATALYENARREAAQIIATAEATIAQQRRQALAAARQQAAQILTQGRQSADSQRADVIAHAGADAQTLETVSARHFEDAVTLVLNKATGRA
jgi:vacuolar-type H+-ATPase subunit H